MSKSFKGNSEQHGKMVKQKSGLNRSILDQGGEFRRQLDPVRNPVLHRIPEELRQERESQSTRNVCRTIASQG